MDRPPRGAVIEIRDFKGLSSNRDEMSVPREYSVEQTNITNIRPNRLQVRGGWTVVNFDS